MAATSVHEVFATLRAALNQAVADRLIEWNPCLAVRVGKGTPTKGTPVTLEIANQVLAAARDDRLYSLVVTGLCSGARPCEVRALGPEHVDAGAGTLMLARHLVRVPPSGDEPGRWEFRPGSKTGRTYTVPLPRVCREALAERLKVLRLERMCPEWQEWGLLWPAVDGRPLDPSVLRAHLAAACRAAGLPRLTPHHFFRRGASTLLKAHGVDARTRAALLGHARVETTENVYTDVLPAELWAAAETMGRILRADGSK